MALFDEHDIANDPIQSPSQVLKDPQAAALGLFTQLELTGENPVALPGCPSVTFADSASIARGAAPNGQHGRAILREAGYKDAEIDALIRLGAVPGAPA